MKSLALLTVVFALVGCQQFNKLANGETRRNDSADTTPPPIYIDGVTSFDFDTVYNIGAVSLVKVKRPTEMEYGTLNIYEYSYDATAHTLHFGKLVAVSSGGLTVEDSPAAPTGTQYRIQAASN